MHRVIEFKCLTYFSTTHVPFSADSCYIKVCLIQTSSHEVGIIFLENYAKDIYGKEVHQHELATTTSEKELALKVQF